MGRPASKGVLGRLTLRARNGRCHWPSLRGLIRRIEPKMATEEEEEEGE
jgi:hypothetical protein